MDWNWLSNQIGGVTLAQIIVWVVVAVLIIIGIRRIWPAVKAIVQFADTWSKLPKFMADTDTSIGQMKTQLLNNHPQDPNMREEITEAKDAANRAVQLVEGMHGRMDALEASNDRQEVTLTDVQAKLTRDHKRISDIEHTMPKREIERLVADADEERDE